MLLEPYSIVQKSVMLNWIPVCRMQFASCQLLKKDKGKGTAFLGAQIFVSGRRKYIRNVTDHPQVAENKHWHFACFLTSVTQILVSRRQQEMKDREKWMELCRQASVEQKP